MQVFLLSHSVNARTGANLSLGEQSILPRLFLYSNAPFTKQAVCFCSGIGSYVLPNHFGECLRLPAPLLGLWNGYIIGLMQVRQNGEEVEEEDSDKRAPFSLFSPSHQCTNPSNQIEKY